MRNKGFTMVEMLAVVVLIGLLTVLVVSKIKPSISDSKESVAFSSASSLVTRLEEYYFEQKMMGNFIGCTYDFESDNNGCSGFSFTGDKPTGGSVTLSVDGIINGTVVFGKFSYEIKDNKVIVPEIAYEPKIPVGTEYVFDYTGSEVVLTILSTGNYKLETWGAQGGNANNNRGGYGGYSTGTVYLKEGTKLYINVGGQGSSGDPAVMHAGGYNGGGSVPAESGGNRYVAGGGGATHISLQSGLLSSLSSNLDSILIVSGGGGGGYEHTSAGYNGIGGDAGGFVGSDGTYGSSGGAGYGTGGTQTSGGIAYGTSEYGGSFGLGGTTGSGAHGSAGGGGFYGGGASTGGTLSSGNSSGGGGSSYIGNDLLYDKYMYCYECTVSSVHSTLTYSTSEYSESPVIDSAKVGNGYAKITYLGLGNETDNDEDEDITNGLRDRVLNLYASEIESAANYYIVYRLTNPMSADLILYDDNFDFRLKVENDTSNIPFFKLDLVNSSSSYKIISGITLDFDGSLENVSDSYRTFSSGYQLYDGDDSYYIEFFGYPGNIDDYQAYKPHFNKIVNYNTNIKLDDIITIPDSYNGQSCADYIVLTYRRNAQFYCFTEGTSVSYVPSDKKFKFNYNGNHIYRFKYDDDWNISFETDMDSSSLVNNLYLNQDILDIILLSTFDITDSDGNIYFKANTTKEKLSTNYVSD